MSRRLSAIAREIQADWKRVNYAAQPYLRAMSGMGSIEEDYGMDSGKSVVRYFLANASSWRGETARRIKKELKSLL